MRIILNLNEEGSGVLAWRAAQHLIHHPEKPDALLEYATGHRFWVKRNKASIGVWEQ